MLPGEVYETPRGSLLPRVLSLHMAADVALPLLQDIVPSMRCRQELPLQAHSEASGTYDVERMPLGNRSVCARMHAGMSAEGGRIHVIAMNRPELRAGPLSEPQARD